MKILIIECTAEELRANRTIMDNITEALSSFTRSFAGVDLNSDRLCEALADANGEKEPEEDET